MKYLFIITAVLIEIKSLAENFKSCFVGALIVLSVGAKTA